MIDLADPSIICSQVEKGLVPKDMLVLSSSLIWYSLSPFLG